MLAESTQRVSRSLILGTVQLGLPYGIANKTGMPSVDEARAIIDEALRLGVTCFDTAQAYGESEKRVGDILWAMALEKPPTIITKLSPFSEWSADMALCDVEEAVRESVLNSCQNLHRDTLDVLMLHRWGHYAAYEGVIWKTLLALKKEGRIQKLGVSVQNPTEALEALNEPAIEVIQLPFNILDWRWDKSGVIDAIRLKKKRGPLVIHVRSVYLQGLLLLPSHKWPQVFTETNYVPERLLTELGLIQKELDCCSLKALLVNYVLSHDWINALVMGVDTIEQLQENVELFDVALLSSKACHMIASRLEDSALISKQLLDPSEWS